MKPILFNIQATLPESCIHFIANTGYQLYQLYDYNYNYFHDETYFWSLIENCVEYWYWSSMMWGKCFCFTIRNYVASQTYIDLIFLKSLSNVAANKFVEININGELLNSKVPMPSFLSAILIRHWLKPLDIFCRKHFEIIIFLYPTSIIYYAALPSMISLDINRLVHRCLLTWWNFVSRYMTWRT